LLISVLFEIIARGSAYAGSRLTCKLAKRTDITPRDIITMEIPAIIVFALYVKITFTFLSLLSAAGDNVDLALLLK
jgi:hypothetical protein